MNYKIVTNMGGYSLKISERRSEAHLSNYLDGLGDYSHGGGLRG